MTLTAAQFDELIEGLPEAYKPRFRGPGRKQFADTLVKLYILSEEGRLASWMKPTPIRSSPRSTTIRCWPVW